ncbi:MAG: hypothetical protein ABIR92_11495 [Gemmatimonadaceae bacterium]
MSDKERPDVAAYRELQTVVRSLVDELAGFRKRALAGEAKVKGFESATGSTAKTGARLAVLEAENARLRAQVERARSSSRGMLDKVRFLRQQAQAGEK